MKKIIVLFALSVLLFSCGNNQDKWITGKWRFNGIQSINKNNPGGVATAAFAFLNLASDSSILEFNADKTFKVIRKNGTIFNEGSYQLTGDSLISLTYKNNSKEECVIKRPKDDVLNLNSVKDSVNISFMKIK